MYTYDEAVSKISETINTCMLESAVISGPLKKSGIYKVRVKAVSQKGKRYFQLEKYIDTKVLHENCPPEDIIERIVLIMRDGFKQCSITADKCLTVLMNKKGGFTLTGIRENPSVNTGASEHNREKNYILNDGEFVPWMYKLGLTDINGTVISKKQKKFRQINRFLEMLGDVEEYIPDDSVIVDMGCGKSYLTFAMYHYLNTIKHKNVTIRGYDLKSDVVDHCNSLAEQFGFERLKFYAEDIADLENANGKIAMIITLHACDTATDIALYHGIRWGCRVIMSVPCCQHELFKQIKNKDMDIILKHGILKERFSAVLTDAIRAEVLEIMGYKTSVMEFVDMEHTPKNIMIRAVKSPKTVKKDKDELMALTEAFGIRQTLCELCFGEKSGDSDEK